MTVPTRALTYEEFIALAKENYTKGGDSVVECWRQADFDEYVKEFGPMTEARAKRILELYAVQHNEHQSMADW